MTKEVPKFDLDQVIKMLTTPEADAIFDAVLERYMPRIIAIVGQAANDNIKVQSSDNHREFPAKNSHGALGRKPENEREEALARLDPGQIEATFGWEKFDRLAGLQDLSTRDAAYILGVSMWTLRNWRRGGNEGAGPRYTQLVPGRSPVRYQLEDLLEFMEARKK